jgi:hypothetical protein
MLNLGYMGQVLLKPFSSESATTVLSARALGLHVGSQPQKRRASSFSLLAKKITTGEVMSHYNPSRVL